MNPHSAPVPDSAWVADAAARERGRVEIFNSTRPGGLDGWTMDLGQYTLMREHIMEMVTQAGAAGVLLRDVVDAAQLRYGRHEAFPGGRLRNYCTYTKVDLEARGLIQRDMRSSPQRLRLVQA